MRPTLFLVFITFLQATASQDSIPLIPLTTGHIIEGYHFESPSGHSANVYLGVPFAEPPIGALRFRKTQPLLPVSSSNTTTTPISCRTYKPSCLLGHEKISTSGMSEDCLYLNVFSGVECEANGSLCPVMYYIHGGAYEFDTPTMFPVDILVENFASKGIVVVTVPYRLGVFGFWSTGDSEAPGNYAMYDMIEGLKWVQREIKSFGGDTSKVTIMGHSSGAAAVSLLTLTPKSKRLFRRAVLMSRAPTILERMPQNRKFAEKVGCAAEKSQEITDCMRKIDAKSLLDSYWEYEEDFGDHLSSPRIDGPDGLFPEPLSVLYKTRRAVDAIVGTTLEESGPDKVSHANATAEDISDLCQAEIGDITKHGKLLTLECNRRYVVSPLVEYGKTKNSEDDAKNPKKFGLWAEQYAKFKSDIFYYGPAYEEASTLVDAGSRVFLYSFDYVKPGWEGIAPFHAFDLTYVFGIHPFDEFDERDRQVRVIYSSLFANFIKHGNPTPPSSDSIRWDPLQNPPFDMNYYSIDLPAPSMQEQYHYEAVLFWNYIVPTIGETKLRHTSTPPHQPVRKFFVRNAIDARENAILKMESARNLSEGNGNHAIMMVLLLLALLAVVAATCLITMAIWSRSSKTYPTRRPWLKHATEEDSLLKGIETGYQTI